MINILIIKAEDPKIQFKLIKESSTHFSKKLPSKISMIKDGIYQENLWKK